MWDARQKARAGGWFVWQSRKKDILESLTSTIKSLKTTLFIVFGEGMLIQLFFLIGIFANFFSL
jgi:hypothetical protein